MTGIVRNERGIALAVAILALVVVGALVAGAFFAGTQEQRLGLNAKRATQAFGVAETGVAEQLRLWEPTLANQMVVYPADSYTVTRATTPSRTGSYGGRVYKLNRSLYLIDVSGADSASGTGRVTDGGARQRIGLLGRARLLEIDIRASLTTQGNVFIRGNSEVNGTNENPPGWLHCTALGSDTMPDTTGVRTSGVVQETGNGHVNGNPPVLEDGTVSSETFTEFGDVTFDEVAARANVRLGSGTFRSEPRTDASGVCDRSDRYNWGDGLNPLGPCAGYFPIVYIDGDATLNGVQGQGILLVRGNLYVQGSYEYFGIVIALGDLTTSGGGNSEAHFWGGVMARNADLSTQQLAGRATLSYSPCAILTALQATSIVAPLRSRGWAQLF